MMKLCLAICLILAPSIPLASSEEEPDHLLILASYSPGMKWEDDIISAIRTRMAVSRHPPWVEIDYLDAKRVPLDDDRVSELSALYRERYSGKKFDLIISLNADAFNFLLQKGGELFPGVPVVFCGLMEDMVPDERRGFTGVIESYDLAGTIDLMLDLHPGTERILVVNDRTTTGRSASRALDRVLPAFQDRVSFEVLEDITAEELMDRISGLSEGSLILLLTFNRDRDGRILTYEEAAHLVRMSSDVPCYSVYDFYIGYGVVGGRMMSGASQGAAAADLALRVLGGEPVEEVPLKSAGPNQYIFDHFELERFSIDPRRLPPGSIIVNQPFQPHSDLEGLDLSGMDLSWADLTQSDLEGADLRGSNLTGVSLRGARLCGARLEGAGLVGADMEEATLIGADLSGANLSGAILIGSALVGMNLSGVDLSGAALDQARMAGSDLRYSKLDGASMTAVDLNGSDLTGASLVGVPVSYTHLR
ncbi:MAG: pentapeptide repeat-containing protein, partial [Methanothrix sp.]|nr:pentapeptide repeat-containing protein [Methanothrix sp.]